MPTTGINLKAGSIDKESVAEVGRIILLILESEGDESTIQCALNTFENTCPRSSIDHMMISDCNLSFGGGEKTERND